MFVRFSIICVCNEINELNKNELNKRKSLNAIRPGRKKGNMEFLESWNSTVIAYKQCGAIPLSRTDIHHLILNCIRHNILYLLASAHIVCVSVCLWMRPAFVLYCYFCRHSYGISLWSCNRVYFVFGPPLNAEYSNYYFALNHHRIEKFNGLKTEPIQARIMRASARTDHGRLWQDNKIITVLLVAIGCVCVCIYVCCHHHSCSHFSHRNAIQIKSNEKLSIINWNNAMLVYLLNLWDNN